MQADITKKYLKPYKRKTMTKLLKITVLLSLMSILTSCSVLSFNYINYINGTKIKKDDSTVFLSLTNSGWGGNTETIYVRFESLEDGKTYNIESQICESKVFLGPLVKLFAEQPKDTIQQKGYCGNIAVGMIPEGKYKLKYIWVRSYNEGKYQNNKYIKCKPIKSFEFSKNNTYYLGNIDIKILDATLGGYIIDLDLKTTSHLARDTALLTKYYSSVNNKNIHDVSFSYAKQYRKYK